MKKETIFGSLTAPFVKAARSSMDQRSIVVFLHLKGLPAKAKDVHTELIQVLGSDAIAYSTVTKYIRNDLIWQNEPEAEERAEDQDFWIPDNAILEAFEMMLFASIRQIAQVMFIPPPTVFRRLTKFVHFVLKRLCWAPHRLSDLQNSLGSSCQRSY
jgi:hypothetical protein